MASVFIIGATSAIAHATAKQFAISNHSSFLLTVRNPDKLVHNKNELAQLGANSVSVITFDATDFESHTTLITEANRHFPEGVDYILIAYGELPDQDSLSHDSHATVTSFRLNATSTISLLTAFSHFLEKQGHGTLAVISSVSGDRGRPGNYTYGAAKGAVSLFAQGLRSRLTDKNIQVVTIKPGFVDTPMTAELPKSRLFADPDKVGKKIYSAMIKGKDVVYIPSFWRGIMAVIKLIPERIFKRLDF